MEIDLDIPLQDVCIYTVYMCGRIHTRYVYILFTCAYSLVSFYCFILGLGHGERKPGDFRPEWPCLPSRPRLKHQPGDPGTEGLGKMLGPMKLGILT